MCDQFGVHQETSAGAVVRVRHSNFERGGLHHTIYPSQSVYVDKWDLPAAVSIELNDKCRNVPRLWLHAVTVTWCGAIQWTENLEEMNLVFEEIEKMLGISKGSGTAKLSRERLGKSLSVSQRLLHASFRDRTTIQDFPRFSGDRHGAVVASHESYTLASTTDVNLPAGMDPVDDIKIQAIDRPSWFEEPNGEDYAFIHGIYTPVTELVGV